MQLAACYSDVIRVPEGRAASIEHMTFPDIQAADMPERVAQVESTAFSDDIRRFLDGTFSIGRAVKNAVQEMDIAGAIQGTFFIINLVFYDFHN